MPRSVPGGGGKSLGQMVPKRYRRKDTFPNWPREQKMPIRKGNRGAAPFPKSKRRAGTFGRGGFRV